MHRYHHMGLEMIKIYLARAPDVTGAICCARDTACRTPGHALSFAVMSDDDETTYDVRSMMLARLTLSERFVRALALSAYVRALAWQGAQRTAQAGGDSAVVDRFLTQLYGTEVATAFRTARDQRSA